jgi:hypothetical protein
MLTTDYTDYTDDSDFEEISAYGETFAALRPAGLIDFPAHLIDFGIATKTLRHKEVRM